VSKFVLKDAYVAINGTAISDHCSSVTVESTFDEVDFTAFGASNYREFGQGMGDATITLTCFQDFASGSVDAIFWPLSQSGGTFGIEVRPTSAAASSTNPKYTMTGRLFEFNPLAGDVGDASTTDVPIRNAGTAGLVRGTA
jgi:hypothetical protein